ncbi:C40 family peptidase [Marinobacter halotolerans]|uniref:C40 family peptidase n=1 Tax=Marinobacter halotolerans TaxID=1569211 RepID=UPI001CD944FD|nr:C40 family peptidase [Marinobacter halotolerans]
MQSANEHVWQPADQSTADSEAADRLWQVFERYEGTPYRYGGTSAKGFDCSGFIATAFDEALGLQLPRTTSQMLAEGDIVPRDQLRAGDLVFFRIKDKDQHAGIYMGGDSFIHSSTSSGVSRSSLNGYYWRDRLSQARRFD